MKKDIYWYVTILAMIAMPAAAAINFGDAAYDALAVRTFNWLAVAGGLFTGLGFEFVGILAGHNAIRFYSKNDKRWIIAAIAMCIYIAIGMYELFLIPFARFVPLLSGLVYVMAGLENQAVEEDKQKLDDNSYQKKLDLLQVKLDHERQMKQDELNTQIKIERVKIKAMPASSRDISRKNSRQSASKPAKHYECVCGRVFEGSRSYNAHRSHCEIPANEPARIYENGSEK